MSDDRVPTTVYYPSETESRTVSGRAHPQPSVTDLGKRVLFTSINDKKEKYGTLRYWGRPEFAKGMWCGVELDEPTGKNNGSVQGIRYFSCPHNCGTFVHLCRVQLDPAGQSRVRSKSSASSILEKRARKNYVSKAPFFYNTLPRSSSIPALNQGGFTAYYFNKPTSKRPESPEHRASVPSGPLSPSYRGLLTSTHYSPMKKYTSESNLPQKTQTKKVPSRGQQPPSSNRQKVGRRPLGSCSEKHFSGMLTEGPLKSSASCQDLSYVKKRSPKQILLTLSPQTSPPPHDSEDGFSFCSSTSDLSHRDSSSDSDLTPRSSSNSPCFLDAVESTGINDNAFILTPPTPKTKKSPSHSPTHRVNLPTGLATATSSLIESSRAVGNYRECPVQSPEHQKSTKRYQNPKNSRPTLDHPLVNGLAANESNKENDQRSADVFVCPSSGQEMTVKQPNGVTTDPGIQKLQDQLSTCLKQQVAMDARLCRMEENLKQFQSVFIKTMEQVQETLQKQVCNHNFAHTNNDEPELWALIHPQEKLNTCNQPQEDKRSEHVQLVTMSPRKT